MYAPLQHTHNLNPLKFLTIYISCKIYSTFKSQWSISLKFIDLVMLSF